MFMSESCRLNLAIGWVGLGGGEVCTKIRHAQGKMATAVTFYKMADLDPIAQSHSHSPFTSRTRRHTLTTHSRNSLSRPAFPNVAAHPPGDTRSLKMRTE